MFKTIEVFKYDELPENVKDKVIDNNWGINVDDSFWNDYTLDYWKEKLESRGFINPEINFSGFASQGDGASFTCDSIDFPSLFKSQKDTKRFAGILRNLDNGNLYLSAKLSRTDYHYVHEYTVNVDYVEWDWYGDERHDPNLNDNPLSKTLDELEGYIIDIARPLMKQIYRELEKEYVYLTSRESVEETLRSNGYTFRLNGKIENL